MAILKDSYKPTANLAYYPFISTSYHLAQTFTASATYKITGIAIKAIALDEYLNGVLSVNLYAVDGSHKPTGSVLATATKDLKFIRKSTVQSYTFLFTEPYLVTSTTEYALVFSGTVDIGRVRVQYTKLSAYSNGTFFISANSGSTWTAQSYGGNEWDMWFETYTNYDIQASLTTGTEGSEVLAGDTWGGQTFTPASDFILKSVEFKMARVTDTDIGAVIVSLRATDINSKPSGEDISIGVRYSADIPLLASGRDWIEFTFDIPYKVSASTLYAFTVHVNQAANSLSVGEVTPSGYAGGAEVVSTDGGDTWTVNSDYDYLFRVYGTQVGAGQSGISPSTDANVTTKLYAIGASEFWYVDTDGSWVVLSDSIGDIDSSLPLTHVEAYGKVFIANGHNKKVADFSNVKIATTSIGTHPPDFGTILTGDTSGAAMVVDYIDAISGAVTIYGRRVNNYPFQASETVTGLDDDENNISFTTSAAEVRGPHWYTWTVFGNSTNFGAMPEHAALVSLFNGRLVLAGSEDYPHEWWMSRVYNPFDFLYKPGDPLSPITSGSIEAGQIGDVITALIPYADDFFVFGCLSSMYLLDGDPAYGGTIEELTENEGVYGPHSWCKDRQSNLYFFSGDGLYRCNGGRSKPVSLSESRLPNWSNDWEINPDKFRVVLSFDPIRNGILISHSNFTNGANLNYWYAVKLDGFYPESLPTDCAVFSSYAYRAKDEDDQLLLVACNDGYIRTYSDGQRDDVLNDDSTSIISSHVSMPIVPLNPALEGEGKLQQLFIDLAKNVTITTAIGADGTLTETEAEASSVDYEIYVGRDADTVLANLKRSNDSFTTGTLSTSGLSQTLRPRARGNVLGIKLLNDNEDETWAVNSISGYVIPVR